MVTGLGSHFCSIALNENLAIWVLMGISKCIMETSLYNEYFEIDLYGDTICKMNSLFPSSLLPFDSKFSAIIQKNKFMFRIDYYARYLQASPYTTEMKTKL